MVWHGSSGVKPYVSVKLPPLVQNTKINNWLTEYLLENDIIVSESEKLLIRILRGTSDAHIPFEGMCRLLRHLGFEERTRGSHHIFTRDGVEEILNLQSKAGRAKPYQVKQVRQVILRYRLGGREDEQ